MSDHETVWGVPELDNINWIAKGLTEVQTAAHGGLILSDERFAEMPWPFREFPALNGPRFWEQNNDACVVVAAFPDLFPQDRVQRACDLIRHYATDDEDYLPLLDHLPAGEPA